MTKNAKVTGVKFTSKKKTQKQSTTPSVSTSLTSINDKFKKLKELREQIQSLKTLYAQHDNLMAELLPLFISVEDDRFVIAREIKIGTKKHRFTPFFYDEKKAQLTAKVWKSTAFESGIIA